MSDLMEMVEDGGLSDLARTLWAASRHGQHGKLNLFIHFGANINEKNNSGCTALHMACTLNAGHPRCVELLLAAGADVHATTTKGYTPLALACYWKHSECARLLVLAGANLHAPAMGTPPGTSTTVLEWATKFQRNRRRHRGSRRLPSSRAPILEPLQLEPEPQVPPPRCVWFNGAADVVLQGALAWSPQTHNLFPPAARVCAVQLLILSYLMDRSDPVSIPRDVWLASVIPHVLGRAIEWRLMSSIHSASL